MYFPAAQTCPIVQNVAIISYDVETVSALVRQVHRRTFLGLTLNIETIVCLRLLLSFNLSCLHHDRNSTSSCPLLMSCLHPACP